MLRSSIRVVGDYLAYLAVRCVICVVQALSMSTCHRLARWLAWLVGEKIGLRRSIVFENLALAFPERSKAERKRLAVAMWEHLFLMVVELAHAPRKIHDTNWRDYIKLDHGPQMMRLLWSDRPKILVAGHFGNFELGNFVLGLFGFPTYAIARPLDNRFLHDYVTKFRGGKGQHIVDKDGSAQLIDDLLKRGEAISMLADQHAGPKGSWVDFFGRPASHHKAIAIFSLGSDAPLVVCYSQRDGAPLCLRVGMGGLSDPRTAPESMQNVTGLTQWFASCLEAIIRRQPQQYWWVHRRWRDAPPAKAKRAKAA